MSPAEKNCGENWNSHWKKVTWRVSGRKKEWKKETEVYYLNKAITWRCLLLTDLSFSFKGKAWTATPMSGWKGGVSLCLNCGPKVKHPLHRPCKGIPLYTHRNAHRLSQTPTHTLECTHSCSSDRTPTGKHKGRHTHSSSLSALS